MFDSIDISTIASLLLTFILGLGGYRIIAKRKIKEIRKLIESVDNALYDDKISEDEFRDIFRRFKVLI